MDGPINLTHVDLSYIAKKVSKELILGILFLNLTNLDFLKLFCQSGL